ncbi:glutamate racemase [Sediminibacterium sp. TEGAF015]|uniref:glutamate racemase n=1 Tax=Sediminibacterium sp. TEGAF015 TaxID=575378 RepID=UPI00220289D5|nr:glutamate racemase [Sediminibacterium sp. TEGAF015]BDQ12604.1 glutamate racemase [Sediminibacterium sp. TEGAF015]
MHATAPIGVFDSGYGGLTILKELKKALPQYDYLYLGDNARAPYGTRSFETVYQYTLEAVDWFFTQGCELVILACNTASAKALRTIQQKNLAAYGPSKRVLGVIRPTAEVIGRFSESGQLGVLATKGTVISESYILEIAHFFPEMSVYQQACPMWVPLIENGEHVGAGADYFVKNNLEQLLQQSPAIDTILLACTHYPLLIPKISAFLPSHIQLIAQGEIVAQSLVHYLERHPAMAEKCSKNGQIRFCTTDSTADFDEKGAIFFGKSLKSTHILLGH